MERPDEQEQLLERGLEEDAIQAEIDQRSERAASMRTEEREAERERPVDGPERNPERVRQSRKLRESEARERPAETDQEHADPADQVPLAPVNPVQAPASAEVAPASQAEPTAPLPTPTTPTPGQGTGQLPLDPALLQNQPAPALPAGSAGQPAPRPVAGPDSIAGLTAASNPSGEARNASVRSVRTVEGRPAPTEADLDRANRVLDAVRIRLQPGLRQATLQLQPEELGRVLIKIRLDGSKAQAVVRAETSEALAILEKHTPELRSMFEQQGFEGLELDLGLASEERGDRGEFAPELWNQNDTNGDTEEQEPDLMGLARALNDTEGLDLWA